ncbi:MAG: sulfoxide reductase heme-binding subunit YedZ [Gammaproteobacteria bacterium]|jgi:sulfoxide reductase heme-binding subunit YedZ
MPIKQALKSVYAKPVLFLLCQIPFLGLLWAAFSGNLGVNPIETLTFETGDWTLRMLLITLAVSPLCQWTRQVGLMRFRRMLGLYTFFYGMCHFSIWFIADHSFDFIGMFEDIVKRPYITLGFSALMLMLPLAITSNQWMIRRLGRKWKTLHKLIYLIIILGVLHYLWLVKADYIEPIIYAVIAAILLLHRMEGLKRFLNRSSRMAGTK